MGGRVTVLSADQADLALAVTVLATATLTVSAYAVRAVRYGRVHSPRVERQDASALMGRWLMEAGYWALQPVARGLIACRISPDALSWLSLAAAIVAGAAMTARRFGLATVTGVVSGLLDVLDGMVARHTGVASEAGEVLDASMDRCAEFVFLAGIAVAYREDVNRLALTLLALFGSFMVSYSTAKAEALSVTLPPGSMRRPVRAFYLLAGAVGSAFMTQWGGLRPWGVPGDAAMLVALGVVAAGATLSAAWRLREVARVTRARDLGGSAAIEARAPRRAASPLRAWRKSA
jgi:phosphatidylglycerophosphate synthase